MNGTFNVFLFCFYNDLDVSVKEEGDNIGIKSESKPAITVEGGVTSMCIFFRNLICLHTNYK
jgi:hypothetical protein